LFSIIQHKINKVLLKNSNSGPFLSGDLFKQNSDLKITEKWMKESINSHLKVSNAQVIFCESHLLTKFLDLYGNYVQAKVLICGNSDFDFNVAPTGIPKSVKLCLLQNLNFESDFFRVLPIGLENLSLAMNGYTKYYSMSSTLGRRINKVLVGPFSPTHPERNQLINEISNNPNCEIINTRLSTAKYQEILGQYKYVLCPRGNGLDTHRFWETLYKCNIPVISESPWSNHISRIGIPFQKYTDIEAFIASSEMDNYAPLVPARIEALWWPYWRQLITSVF
jgi:hypothetical protein